MEKTNIQKAITDCYLLKLENEKLISNADAVEIKKLMNAYIEKSKAKEGKIHE